MYKRVAQFLAGVVLGMSSIVHAGTSGEYLSLEVSDLSPVGQLHGDPINADLRIFMAGNQFVVMDQLVKAFQEQYPQYKEIFYVTLPPGTELSWILAGGVEFFSPDSLATQGLQLKIRPDVYSTINTGHLQQLYDAGLIESYYTYAHNRLALMVSASDPLAYQSIDTAQFYALMADSQTHVSEPDITNQGIERHVWQMYTAATKTVFPDDADVQAMDAKMFDPAKLPLDPPGSLRRIVYYDKVEAGITEISHIAHHLETPAWIRDGTVRLGPVWITEAMYAINRLGETDLAPVYIDGKDLNGAWLDRRDQVNYMVTRLRGAHDQRHKQAAEDWIEFLRGDTAQGIYEAAGFQGATLDELSVPYVYPRQPRGHIGY